MSAEERSARTRWRLVLALAFLLTVLFTYDVLVARKADPDMFWHVKVGEGIARTGRVPAEDTLSWYGAERGSRWLAQEWLSELAFFAVYRLGGFVGLYAAVSLLAGAAFLLAYALALARTRRAMTSLVVATLLTAGLVPYLAPRPQMFTYCLLLSLMLCLERRRYWAAVPIVLLGVNLHGGVYPVYLVIIAFYALPAAPAVLAASAAAVLANPGGVALLAVPFRAPEGANPIVEFAQTTLVRYPLDLLAVLAVVVLLSLSGRRVPLRDGLMALAFTVLAFVAQRHVVFLYVVVVPILAPYLVPAPTPSAERDRSRGVPVLEGALAATLALTVGYLGILAARPASVERGYPAAALAYLQGARAEHVMNDWHDGGYMIYRGARPFVDGRGDPYLPHSTRGVNVFGDWADAVGRRADLQPFLAKYDIRWVLVGKKMPFYRVLDHNELVDLAWQDGEYAVFRVRSSALATAPAAATASR